jgi:hypothetical protein
MDNFEIFIIIGIIFCVCGGFCVFYTFEPVTKTTIVNSILCSSGGYCVIIDECQHEHHSEHVSVSAMLAYCKENGVSCRIIITESLADRLLGREGTITKAEPVGTTLPMGCV